MIKGEATASPFLMLLLQYDDNLPCGEGDGTMIKRLAELREYLGEGEVLGDGSIEIRGVCSAVKPRAGMITFANNSRWLKRIEPGSAAAVITSARPAQENLPALLHPNPYLAFVKIVRLFHPEEEENGGISGHAAISADATLGRDVSLGPFVSVGRGAAVADGTTLDAGVRIGADAVIGSNCRLHANVVIEDRCVIGDNVIIHAGTIIGADGFGYIQHQGKNVKVPQIGRVVIGNDVEIGANCCIDRGTIDDTVIGNGVVLDNLVQIGHNVTIEDNAVIVAQVGLAGSSSVGKGAMLGGKAGATEHVRIGPGAILAAQAIATREIKGGTMNAGNPATDIETWRKSKVIARKLPAVWSKIQKLIKDSE